MPLPTSRRFVTDLLNSLPSPTQSNSDTDTGANPLDAAEESTKKQLLSLQVLFPNEFLPSLDLLDRRLVTRLRISDGDEKNASSAWTTANVAGHAVGNIDDTAMVDPDPHNEQRADKTDDTTNIPLAAADPHHPLTEVQTTTTPTLVSARSSYCAHDTIYYVRSAQQRSSRYSTSFDTTTSYEVRLLAWNCSCPAFAFAAFPAVHPEPPIPAFDPTESSGGYHASERHGGPGAGWMFGGVSLGDGMAPVCKHLLACVLVEKCSGLLGGFVEERRVSVEEAAGWAAGWGD